MAVLSESAVLATMVTFAVMIVGPILAQKTTLERLLTSEWSRDVVRVLYYILPKVYDLGRISREIVLGQPIASWMPVWTSALFGIVVSRPGCTPSPNGTTDETRAARTSRNWFAVSPCAVAAALDAVEARQPPRIALLALTALGCRSAEVSHARVDPELASFVSPDAVMLAGIRMEEVRATPLYQKLMSRQKLDQMDRFAAETGFDPRKDVRDLLVASDGKRTTVVARGRFDQIKVKNATRSSYGGYTLYNGGEGGVALISRSIAVAGNIDAVKAAIDRNKTGTGSQTGLIARAEQVPRALKPGWFRTAGDFCLAAACRKPAMPPTSAGS